MRNCRTHTVRIGIGCNQQIGLDRIGKTQGKLQSLTKLRIWIGARWEIAVGLCLFRNNGHIMHADFLQNTGNKLHTGTIKRRVNNLVSVGSLKARNGNALDGRNEVIENFFGSPFNETLCETFIKVHYLYVKGINACDIGGDFRRCLVGNLTTVIVIYLVTVIDGGVMRSRKHDTCGRMKIAHRK